MGIRSFQPPTTLSLSQFTIGLFVAIGKQHASIISPMYDESGSGDQAAVAAFKHLHDHVEHVSVRTPLGLCVTLARPPHSCDWRAKLIELKDLLFVRGDTVLQINNRELAHYKGIDHNDPMWTDLANIFTRIAQPILR